MTKPDGSGVGDNRGGEKDSELKRIRKQFIGKRVPGQQKVDLILQGKIDGPKKTTLKQKGKDSR